LRLFWPAVVWRALTGADPLHIPVTSVAVHQLEVTLIDDGTGTPTLAHALEPRDPKPADPNAAKTSVEVAELTVAHTRVTGSLASLRAVDADLSELKASLRSDAAGLELKLQNLELEARQLPQVEQLSGRLTAEVVLPAEPTPPAAGAPSSTNGVQTQIQALRPPPAERRVQAAFTGQVAGSGASARVRLVGEELLAELEAAELLPSTLTRVVPALTPTAPVALTAKVEGRLDNLGLEANVRQARSRLTARGRSKRLQCGQSTSERNRWRLRQSDSSRARGKRSGVQGPAERAGACGQGGPVPAAEVLPAGSGVRRACLSESVNRAHSRRDGDLGWQDSKA